MCKKQTRRTAASAHVYTYPDSWSGAGVKYMYRIYYLYEAYTRWYTPLDGLPEAIAEGKPSSGVYQGQLVSLTQGSDLMASWCSISLVWAQVSQWTPFDRVKLLLSVCGYLLHMRFSGGDEHCPPHQGLGTRMPEQQSGLDGCSQLSFTTNSFSYCRGAWLHIIVSA